ncbi:hypothetical protein ACQ4PT_037171 [Festuca glaucescens]
MQGGAVRLAGELGGGREIFKGDMHIPMWFSSAAQDLLDKILEPSPMKRGHRQGLQLAMETGIFVNSTMFFVNSAMLIPLTGKQVNNFILILDNAYTREKIPRMEKAILNMLQWNITIPTPYVFFLQFAAAVTSSDLKNDKESTDGPPPQSADGSPERSSCRSQLTALGAICDHETVPYTNRAHLVILSSSNECKLGDVLFDHVKKKLGGNVLGSSDPKTIRVQLIASDIIHGVHHGPFNSGSSFYNDMTSVTGDMWVDDRRKQGKAAPQQPQTGHLHDLDWEVIIVRDDRVNAYNCPNGKIIVNTGCLNYFKTDAEIATIFAHEVGHVVARHFTEFTQTALLIPTVYKLLPFSRREEIEADLIGVMLLAAAHSHRGLR